MTDKKVNFFLVHTEYHLLIALKLIFDNYLKDEYNNLVYITKSNKRFNSLKEIEAINKNYRGIELKVPQGKVNKELYSEIVNILVDHFFFFQENSIWNRAIAFNLKKKYETKISLCPDGYKPYADYKKSHEFLSMLFDTYRDQKTLLKSKIILRRLLWSRHYRYGSSFFIDIVWLSEPSYFDTMHNRFKGKLKKIEHFDKKSFKFLNQFFRVQINIPKKNILLYLNQPFWTDQLVERELEFLRKLNKSFNKKIYLKLHPGTIQETINKYKTIKNLVIIKDNLPAEFYILSLKDSTIFSGWSSALITNNPSCNYYFNYPIYKGCGAKAVDQSELKILPHIQSVMSPEQMHYPNE